jgi:hypothetical protein
MNQEFLNILQFNAIHVQKYFYDNINSKHSLCDGYIIGYKKNNDVYDHKNNWLKIRKTTLACDVVKRELERNHFKIIFIEHTHYLNNCKTLAEILFTYAKIKRHIGNNTEEWFKIKHPINISNIIKSLITMMDNNTYIYAPLVVKQYIYTDSDTDTLTEYVKKDPDDAEFFCLLLAGAVVLIGGILIGGQYIVKTLFKDSAKPSSIKEGISGEILKLITLEESEMPVCYYTSDKIHIILTDKRFIKIENQHVCSSVYLNQIKFVNHIKKSIFHYDKVETIEDTGRVETFGIYEKSVCAYFVNLLIAIVKDKKTHLETQTKQITTEYPEGPRIESA